MNTRNMGQDTMNDREENEYDPTQDPDYIRLTARQKAFVDEYLVCLNATAAAEKAGYAVPRQTGLDVLENACVKRVLAKRWKARAMSADELVSRLVKESMFDPAYYIGDDGKIDLARLKADGWGFMVRGSRETRNGRDILLADPHESKKLLAKILRLTTHTTLDISGKVDVDAPSIDKLVAMLGKANANSVKDE